MPKKTKTEVVKEVQLEVIDSIMERVPLLKGMEYKEDCLHNMELCYYKVMDSYKRSRRIGSFITPQKAISHASYFIICIYLSTEGYVTIDMRRELDYIMANLSFYSMRYLYDFINRLREDREGIETYYRTDGIRRTKKKEVLIIEL